MLDPLTALSLASSVIQLVDFGSKLLSNSRKLYRSASGVLTEHIHIEVITTDLATLLEGLMRKLPENRLGSSQQFSSYGNFEDSEALDELCRRSVDVAKELVRRLEKLKVEPRKGKTEDEIEVRECNEMARDCLPNITVPGNDRWQSLVMTNRRKPATCFRKWSSFRKALEASWNKNSIEALAATLREFRSEIEFHLLILLRGTLSDLVVRQTHMSNQLTESTRLILDSFLNARDDFASQLRHQAEQLIESQTDQMHDYIKKPQELENFMRGKLNFVGTLQLPKGVKHMQEHVVESSAREYEIEEEVHLLITENGILGSLSFVTLMDRRESVETPYQETFKWIYEGTENSRRPWSSFITWLRQGDGIYWINGKAGSGKSTLMRYISDNDKTREALKEWAGSVPSVTCSFFFWNNGDKYQKTQAGLLRTLLFEILQRYRDLIPEVMPEVWNLWSARAKTIISNKLQLSLPFSSPEPHTWTISQLKRSFRNLLEILQKKQLKVCLFIDGLDEYEGDYYDIVELFQGYSKCPNVKMCLSSRPLLVFEQAFADLPNLRLQDLTYGDISHYVKDRLYRHKYMIQLSRRNAADVSILVNEIVTKASGVFLWVKLVVNSLLRGLSDYNRISDLKKRVEHIPEDLEALYAHMLETTDQFYHEQASRIFQIVMTAQKQSPGKLTLLSLGWAEEEDEMLAERAPVRPYTHAEVSTSCQIMDSRLKSVCAGLLESSDSPYSEIAPDAKIVFLHRTVSDWLAKPLVWDGIVSHTAGKQFSPNLCMLKSCVMQLKTATITPTLVLDMSIISDAFHYAKAAEADLNCGFPGLLDQLDIVASYQWRMGKANISNRVLPKYAKSKRKFHPSVNDHSAVYKVKTSQKPEGICFEHSLFDTDIDSNSEDELSPSDSDSEDDEELSGKAGLLSTSDVPPEQGILSHWSYGLEIPGIKPIGEGSTFYKIAKDLGLHHYVTMKLESAVIDDQDVNQHLLMHAISSQSVPNPEFVDRILKGGIDPNFSYHGMSPWEGVLLAAASHFNRYQDGVSNFTDAQFDTNWRQTAEKWAEVMKVFVKHGADLDLLTQRHRYLHGHPRLSLRIIIDEFCPDFLVDRLGDLKSSLTRNDVPNGKNERKENVTVQEIQSTSMVTWIWSWFVKR